MKILGKHIIPAKVAGGLFQVYLKDRASDQHAFYFRVMECTPDYIAGYDDERMNLKIYNEDIDFLIGGRRK